jgi:hypothetical protein
MTTELSLKGLFEDKRIWYPILLIITALPFLVPIGLPIKVYPWTQAAYDTVNAVPEGSTVIVGMEFSSGGWGEAGYQAKAVLSHALKRNLKLVFIHDPVAPASPMMTERVMQELQISIIDPLGKQYGVDWVNLGIVAGGAPSAAKLAQDFHATIQVDMTGNSLKDLEITKNIVDVHDFALILRFSTGPGFPLEQEWRVIYGIPEVVGSQAMGLTTSIASWEAGILSGFLSGSRGAAEYEFITKIFGDATVAMDAINTSHIFALALLFGGNIWYYLSKGRKPTEEK